MTFEDAFDALPHGAFEAQWRGRLWRAVKSDHAGGRAAKLVAHEAGGRGYVSLNLYRLTNGMRLRPCEMSAAYVTAFVKEAVPTKKGGPSAAP